MTDAEIEQMQNFIKDKGLEEEFKKYVDDKENSANGVEIYFSFGLGDGDGNEEDTMTMPLTVAEEFYKYFTAPEWKNGLYIGELIEITHEYIPGATVYTDQLTKLFTAIHNKVFKQQVYCGTDARNSYASFNAKIFRVRAAEWDNTDVFDKDLNCAMDFDAYEGISSILGDIYFRYVIPYNKEGKFVYASDLGHYKIYAS